MQQKNPLQASHETQEQIKVKVQKFCVSLRQEKRKNTLREKRQKLKKNQELLHEQKGQMSLEAVV